MYCKTSSLAYFNLSISYSILSWNSLNGPCRQLCTQSISQWNILSLSHTHTHTHTHTQTHTHTHIKTCTSTKKPIIPHIIKWNNVLLSFPLTHSTGRYLFLVYTHIHTFNMTFFPFAIEHHLTFLIWRWLDIVSSK